MFSHSYQYIMGVQAVHINLLTLMLAAYFSSGTIYLNFNNAYCYMVFNLKSSLSPFPFLKNTCRILFEMTILSEMVFDAL